MNSRTFLAILAVVCFVAFVNAQQSAGKNELNLKEDSNP